MPDPQDDAAAAAAERWVEGFDPTTDGPYYREVNSGRVQFDPPAGVDPADIGRSDADPEMASAEKLQCA